MAKITGELEKWDTDTVQRSKYSFYIIAIVDGMKLTFFDKDAAILSKYLQSFSPGDYVMVEYEQKGQYSNASYMIAAKRDVQTELPGKAVEPAEAVSSEASLSTVGATVLKGQEIPELMLISEQLTTAAKLLGQSRAYIGGLIKELRKNPITWVRGEKD